MELSDILNIYGESRQQRELARSLLQESARHIHLTGHNGSSAAVALASLYRSHPLPILVIAGDREEAAYFQNDLENLLGEMKALLYPSSYKKPYHLDQPDSNLILQRAEILSRINKHKEAFLAVTYSEAVHERVVTRKSLERNTMELKAGDTPGIDFLMEFLQENHFERTDFVYEPGQFAVRGGIIDIYSFAHELPFRIEFFNDKIESIRTFDPSTQLSEVHMGHITIIPNIQSGTVYEEHESFFDFLPAETIVVSQDLTYTIEAITASLKLVDEKYGASVTIEEEQTTRKVAELFDSAETLKASIAKHVTIEIGSKPAFTPDAVIKYTIRPQPHFNKNFNLLLEDLFTNQRKGYTNILFSESPRQSERLFAIFEDLPRPDAFKGQELKFNSLLTALHQGFIDDE